MHKDSDVPATASDKPTSNEMPAAAGDPRKEEPPQALRTDGWLGGGSDPGNTASRSTGRWWLGVVVGVVIGLPLAWLLSYAATLPFLLGLFFFALFGLVIGAVIHRVASAGRPYGRAILLVGTTFAVLVIWGLALAKEGRDMPLDLAKEASRSRRIDYGGRTVDEFQVHVAGQIRDYLGRQYPPGGTLGYMRWALDSGVIGRGEIEGVTRALDQPQRGFWWAVRVILSVGLLGFGIGSQTLQLRWKADKGLARVRDAADPDDSDHS